MNNIPEKKNLDIGFMPLTDCLPLVVGKEKGFFSAQGLDVRLHKQNSWATLRDKVHSGYLDAAQMLAPMPIASHLGIGVDATAMKVPFVLSYNGNGVTLSNRLLDEMFGADQNAQAVALQEPLSAALLKPIIETRRSKAQKKLIFATVFHFSHHFYQLQSWLAQAEITASDVDVLVIPPTDMVPALASNDIDGFCVGSPWNAAAVRQQLGATVTTSNDLWPKMPEKVLGMTAKWQQQHPNTLKALLIGLEQAVNWLDSIPNRFEGARILAKQQYLNVSLDVVTPALLNSCLTSNTDNPRLVPQYIEFLDQQHGNRPQLTQGRWTMQHMITAAHINLDTNMDEVVNNIYSASADRV
ncbi:MAG: CmpA/NrtA family ABC transporter substrate-binding protein [Aestuariibacter sp.]